MEHPPNGTKTVWYSDDGKVAFLGHWQNGQLVQDRQLSWLAAQGGGSLFVGAFWVLFCAVAFVGVPLGLLYALVRFVKWAWTG